MSDKNPTRIVNWCRTHHQQAQGTTMCDAVLWLRDGCRIIIYEVGVR